MTNLVDRSELPYARACRFLTRTEPDDLEKNRRGKYPAFGAPQYKAVEADRRQ